MGYYNNSCNYFIIILGMANNDKIFKPVAAASGVGAVADAVIPGNGYGSPFDINF